MRSIVLCMVFFLASCSSIEPAAPEKDEGPVSIITGKTGGIKISDLGGSKNNAGISMPVNAILWRASLEIISLIPISEIDTLAGTIVSDWYSLPDKPDERIKLTVFVIDRELRSDAIRVTVHVQTRTETNGDWSTSVRDEEFSRQLENLILNRAREIRAESLTDIAD